MKKKTEQEVQLKLAGCNLRRPEFFDFPSSAQTGFG
jgi:hypothetical protein